MKPTFKKHRFATSLLLLWGLLAALPLAAEPPEGYSFVAFDEGMRRAAASKRPVFVYFGRFGCGWCDKTNKEAFSDARVKQAYSSHYELVYVDAESGKRLTLPNGERITERDLGTRYKAFATPLFVFMHPQGDKIAQIAGLQSAADLLDYDRYVHGGLHRSMDFRSFLGTRVK